MNILAVAYNKLITSTPQMKIVLGVLVMITTFAITLIVLNTTFNKKLPVSQNVQFTSTNSKIRLLASAAGILAIIQQWNSLRASNITGNIDSDTESALITDDLDSEELSPIAICFRLGVIGFLGFRMIKNLFAIFTTKTSKIQTIDLRRNSSGIALLMRRRSARRRLSQQGQAQGFIAGEREPRGGNAQDQQGSFLEQLLLNPNQLNFRTWEDSQLKAESMTRDETRALVDELNELETEAGSTATEKLAAKVLIGKALLILEGRSRQVLAEAQELPKAQSQSDDQPRIRVKAQSQSDDQPIMGSFRGSFRGSSLPAGTTDRVRNRFELKRRGSSFAVEEIRRLALEKRGHEIALEEMDRFAAEDEGRRSSSRENPPVTGGGRSSSSRNPQVTEGGVVTGRARRRLALEDRGEEIRLPTARGRRPEIALEETVRLDLEKELGRLALLKQDRRLTLERQDSKLERQGSKPAAEDEGRSSSSGNPPVTEGGVVRGRARHRLTLEGGENSQVEGVVSGRARHRLTPEGQDRGFPLTLEEMDSFTVGDEEEEAVLGQRVSSYS